MAEKEDAAVASSVEFEQATPIGSEARAGEPLGEWPDEEGVRWLAQPDCSWKRIT